MNGTTFFFGSYRLEEAQRRLWRGSDTVPLSPKAFDTLLLLVRRRGDVVAKETLMNSIWPDTHVEEGNLAFNIATIRRVLGDSGREQQYIATIPGRGYQFVAPVQVAAPQAAAPATAHSLAVLPFRPLVEAHRNEVLELGLADTLITRLGNLRDVVVRPIGRCGT